MRMIALLSIGALIAGTAVGAPVAHQMWSATPAGGTGTPTAQALATGGPVYWNTIRGGDNGAQACSFDPAASSTTCSAAQYASFDQPWVPAAGAELHPLYSAFAFSSAATLSADQHTDVVYEQAASPGQAAKRYAFKVTAESVVALAPLNEFKVALRYARRTIARGEYQDTVVVRSIAAPEFTVLWQETVNHTHAAALPLEAQAIISMEGSTFMYVNQNGQSATLNARTSNGTTQFAKPIPCGIDVTSGFVGIRKVNFQSLETGEVLQAAIVSGRNASVPNGTIFCRVSHHTGNVEGVAVVLGEIQTINHISGGSGQIVVSGYNAAGTSDIVAVFDATTGALRWTQSRAASDAGSGPAVHGGEVFFQSNGALVSRGISFGNSEQRSNISCARTPAVTDSRIYCVEASKFLTAFAPMTNEVIWTTPVDWQYSPLSIPGSLTDTVMVVTAAGTVVGFDTGLPQPPASPASSSNGAVTAIVIVLVLLVLGAAAGGAWFYKTRGGFGSLRSTRHALVNESGDGPAQTPKASHDLYGSA